jgi:hypothetical protein
MTVAVCDRAFDRPSDLCQGRAYPQIPLDPDQWSLSDPVKAGAAYGIWSRQHGALWISIEADDTANQGRSFEVMIHVTETARVDEQGEIQTGARQCKTYTQRMSIRIEISTVTVQTGYFEGWLKAVLNALQSILQRKRAPGPAPRPVEDLVQGRVILEQDPKLLKAFTDELRRGARRRALTSQQALAQLDAAVKHVAGGTRQTLTPAQLEEMAQTAQLPETAEWRSALLAGEQPTEQVLGSAIAVQRSQESSQRSSAPARSVPQRLSVGPLLAGISAFLRRVFTRSR